MLNKAKHKTRLTQNKSKIHNDARLLTLHFRYTEAYICYFMIGGQQW